MKSKHQRVGTIFSEPHDYLSGVPFSTQRRDSCNTKECSRVTIFSDIEIKLIVLCETIEYFITTLKRE